MTPCPGQVKVARLWKEKQKRRKRTKTSNEQNAGWEGLTELITTGKLLGNLQRQNIPFPVQRLSEPQTMPQGSCSAVEGGKCSNSSPCLPRASPEGKAPPFLLTLRAALLPAPFFQGIITRGGSPAPCPPSRAALGAQVSVLGTRRFKESFHRVSGANSGVVRRL